jgi:metallo-beta-lactamase family protein
MPNVSLRFLGAARNVTGSATLLEIDGQRLLVDCGLFQERKYLERNWNPFPVQPSSIRAVLLTHAHLDHCGLLPKLVKEGFGGRVLCTPATAEIARYVLLDSARLQEEDAEHKRWRHDREGRQGPFPAEALYTEEDARRVLPLFATVAYGQTMEPVPGTRVSFHDAGHILGSAMIRVEYGSDGARRTIVFSGDVGRWDRPILRDPTVFAEADYLTMECTYGASRHEDAASIEDLLADAVLSTRRAGGNLLIPSFALERTQEVLYYLSRLLRAGRIPKLLVFVDSPMAVEVTEVFLRHPELFDEEMRALLIAGRSPFQFPGLTMVRSAEQSKGINQLRGTAVIIAGSGMCTGGRIKHHLVNNIGRRESTILFVGYQAESTLGREILQGAKNVRILGKSFRRRARVLKINGFSAHADREELLRWVSGLKSAPRRLFLTHGEPESAQAMADLLGERMGWRAIIPSYGETAVLDQ